ncbi:L,D-transpeptidase [Paractinoplanes durhamensis]|uniref:L,D-transpeptidase n=1 Tax=Paractinoplanes durhamensis TaxID=113563 RepID=UPI0019421F34
MPALVLAFCVLAGTSKIATREPVAPVAQPPPAPTTPAPTPRPTPTVDRILPAAAAPDDLPVISYLHVPRGFPADPDQASEAHLPEGLHPAHQLAVYDAPGGRPRAFLAPTIRGVTVIVPIVAKRPGWSAVLLPSVNRRIGWLPDGGWHAKTLRDHLIVRRGDRTLTWLRDGVRQKTWTVAIGADRTPTPLGRTFVLGRTGTHGSVYAGLDALVLGAVPDDRDAVAPGLRGAHTGIHAWYRSSVFGRNVSNGCVRMPRDAQRTLLAQLDPGTPITVRD